MTTPQELLRNLPAVDKLLQDESAVQWQDIYGRTSVTNAVRTVLEDLRQQILDAVTPDIDPDTILQQVQVQLERVFLPSLRPVINATGVVIHTNLGRSPLSLAAQDAIREVAANYNNLEFDLNSGKRGSRYHHAEELLCDLTGAEAALVVNNNAAALVLMLAALAQGRSVVISRGQLVEIGGGFRIPDIMAQSGAHLLEVGTTNRTRITDYAAAIRDDTALLMRIHSSNFRLIGFVEEAEMSAMATLAHENDLHLVDDIGSGALLNTEDYGLLHEPTINESIAAGADLVLFSGDKLLGAPQAGIIIGKRELVQQLKQHPLARAFRADKLCYAGLYATLDHYRRDEATEKIPIWRMIAARTDELQARVLRWRKHIGGEVIGGESTVGGGSLPGTALPTALLAFTPPSAETFAACLRAAPIPVIARITANRVLFDPRTVLPEQEETLLNTIRANL